MKTRAITKTLGNRAITPSRKLQPQPHFQIKEILVPTDFSKPSAGALKYALGFAKEFGARLTLVSVIEPRAYSEFLPADSAVEDDLAREAKQKLEALRLQQGKEARRIKDVRVLIGKPFQEIARLAQGLKFDLIVIATHGRTGLKHVLMGSTAEKVIRHAPCPVFVVREKERQVLKD